MSAAGTPALRNGMWSSSIGVLALTKMEPWPIFCAVDQMMSVSHGVELAFAHEARRTIGDHVDQHERFQRRQCSGLARGVHVVLAAVGVVGSAPVPQRRLFAVEEDQLDRERIRARLQHAREFDEERGARPAVVRADEAHLAKQLRVVVSRDGDALFPRARDGRDEVDHRNLADGRLRHERLLGHRNAERFELRDDVLARLRDAGRTCGPRTDADNLTQVLVRPGAIERRRRLGAWRCRGQRAESRGPASSRTQNREPEPRTQHPAPRTTAISCPSE